MFIPGSRCSQINSLPWRPCLEKIENLSLCCYPRAIIMHVTCACHVPFPCTSCVIPMHMACVHLVWFSYTRDLPLDESFLCLGIKMVEISREEVRDLSLDCKARMTRLGNPNCGPAFFTCAPTRSARLAFYSWKIIFGKVGVATYFIFILKGK